MTKLKPVFFLMLGLMIFQGESQASQLTTGEKVSRIPALMVRGLFDIASTPAELIRTPAVERKEHPKAWPLTVLPQTFTNIVTRVSSGGYDILFYPFAAPFVDETPPLTEKMGLAGDVWELEDEH